MADPKKGVNPFAKKDDGEDNSNDPKKDPKVEPEKKDPKVDPEKPTDDKGDSELDKEKVSESLKVLFAGSGLSEELIESIVTVSVAAISEATTAAKALAVAEARETYEEKFDQEITKLAESADRFLTQGVRHFIKENEVGITEGLRQEAAGKILESARKICESYGLEITEADQTAIKEAEELVTTANTQLDESLNREMSLTAEIDSLKRERALKSVCEGMVMTDAERLSKLAASVDFINEAEFTASVQTLKESFALGVKTPVAAPKLDEGVKVAVVPVANLDENAQSEPQVKQRRF